MGRERERTERERERRSILLNTFDSSLKLKLTIDYIHH